MQITIRYIILVLILLMGRGNLKAQTEDRKGDKEREKDSIRSREISIESSCNADATVSLDNVFWKITVKASNDNKIRLVTTVVYKREPERSDSGWFAHLGLLIKGGPDHIVVRGRSGMTVGVSPVPGESENKYLDSSGNAFTLSRAALDSLRWKIAHSKEHSVPYQYLLDVGNHILGVFGNGIGDFDVNGEYVNAPGKIERSVILYVPAGVKLDIESKYGDMIIQNNFNDLAARITNAALSMRDADNVAIRSSYGRINAGNMKNAVIEMANGRLYAKKIDKLVIHSSNSTVEFDASSEVAIRSERDQYEIDEIKDLMGTQNFGSLRVTTLRNSFDLIANNADVKIRNIEAGVSLIRIEDKYADIRLPVHKLKNYTVDFDGRYSNIYAPFKRSVDVRVVTDKNGKETAKGSKYLDLSAGQGFKAVVGDTTGKYTAFKLKCGNCTLDFQ